MPRFPQTATTSQRLDLSVYSSLAERAAASPGEIFPLHVGDTFLEPAKGCRMEDLRSEKYPGLGRYAPPQGLPEFLERLAAHVQGRTGVPTTRDDLLVTTGATGGLAAAAGALLEPGEEVLVPAPFWPLLPGIIHSYHGVPVVAPLLHAFSDPEAAIEALESARTKRTAALYLNTPNNPSGRQITREVLGALVEWARQHDLWIWSDEVYEDYAYTHPHVHCRSLAPERTLSIHSFSKAYGMAGYRCGYIVAPQEAISALSKIGTHSFYSTPTAAQHAASIVLGPAGEAWIREAREIYQQTGREAARRLGLPPPDGGTFLFFDLARFLDHRGLASFLEELADQGLLLAPGPSFGPFPTWARLCFTAAPPERVIQGVEILAQALGRSTSDPPSALEPA